MMPTTNGQFVAAQAGVPYVYMQKHLTSISQSVRQSTESLELIKAYMLAPGNMKSSAYGVRRPSSHANLARDNDPNIDFAAAASAMRKLAEQHDVDFDSLLTDASEHFRQPGAEAVVPPLTDEIIKELVEDDNQSLDG